MREEILKYIRQSNELEIEDVLDAVVERYRMLYPDWDLNIVSLPKGNQQERRKRLLSILEFGEKYGNI